VSRSGGKNGPPVKSEVAKVTGDSDTVQRGRAGQGQGERGGAGQGAGQRGGGVGVGEQHQGVCPREDLDRASQVLATAFKVFTHSLYCTATL
jgi:hypothetical protein